MMEIGTVTIKNESDIVSCRLAVMNCMDWLGVDQGSKINLAHALDDVLGKGLEYYHDTSINFGTQHNSLYNELHVSLRCKNPRSNEENGWMKPGEREAWRKTLEPLMDGFKFETLGSSAHITLIKKLDGSFILSKNIKEKIRNDFTLFSKLSMEETVSRMNNEIIESWKEIHEKNKQIKKLIGRVESLKQNKFLSTRQLKSEMNQRIFMENVLSTRSQTLESIYKLMIQPNVDFREICKSLSRELADLFSSPFAAIEVRLDAEEHIFVQWRGGIVSETNLYSLKYPRKGGLGDDNSIQFMGNLNRKISDSSIDIPYKSALCYQLLDSDDNDMISIFILDMKKRSFENFNINVMETFAHYLKSEIHRFRMEKKLVLSGELEVLGKITAGVAHEVRNPLNALMAVSQALFRKLGAQSEWKPFEEHISTQIHRLSAIMNDLLNLGRPLRSENLELIPVSKWVSASVNTWKSSTEYSDYVIEVTLLKLEKDDVVKGDASKLEQVMINLLENACNHSEAQEPVLILVERTETDSVVVKVVDRGTGMKPDIISNFFEPFYSTRKEGTGLGTSIVRRTIERHGGTITVYNNHPGKGLTVEIELPLAI